MGLEEAILQAEGNQLSYSSSRDGRQLIYQTPGQAGASDLSVLPLTGDKRQPYPFLQTRFNKVGGRFSPDGRWISYTSNESGQPEVHVAPFPNADSKSVISTGGGTFSRWSRDGRQILYADPSNRLMAADVDGRGATFRVGAVRPLFQRTGLGAATGSSRGNAPRKSLTLFNAKLKAIFGAFLESPCPSISPMTFDPSRT